MTKKYSYKVISIDENSNTMELLYTAEGFDDITVGTNLPTENMTLEQIAIMYSPVHHWVPPEPVKYTAVPVGTSGELDFPPETTEEAMKAHASLVQHNFDKSIAQSLIRLGVITEDPTSIGVTKLG